MVVLESRGILGRHQVHVRGQGQHVLFDMRGYLVFAVGFRVHPISQCHRNVPCLVPSEKASFVQGSIVIYRGYGDVFSACCRCVCCDCYFFVYGLFVTRDSKKTTKRNFHHNICRVAKKRHSETQLMLLNDFC